MTSDLRPYPEYKDSGLPWLGRVPAHWIMERAKWLYQQMSRPVREEDEVVTCFRDGTVTLRRKRRELGFTNSLKEIGYQGIRKGDLVIHAMDAFAGAVGVADSDGKGTPVYSVCTPKPDVKLDSRYYAYVVREMARSAWILALARGIRERSTDFRFDTFGNQPVSVPPPDEQKAIADYLDANAIKVRRFIRNRRRLIEVLNEQKQAIINRAVTRGLDPNAPLKPSGIDWLGDIPEHWEACRLRNVVASVTSGSRGWSSYAADAGPLFIRIGNLRRVSLDLRFDDVVRLDLPHTSETERTRVRPQDLLVSITAYIGSIAVIPDEFEEAYVSQHVARCPPRDDRHNPRWLGYVLLSDVGQTHGRLSLYGGTKDGLSLDDVKNYPMLLPPRHEQDAIVEYLEQALSATVAAIGKAEREIDLIREYRTRLIADVVTGKVDVRGLAPAEPLPADEQIDEGIDDEEMLGDDEPELVEESGETE